MQYSVLNVIAWSKIQSEEKLGQSLAAPSWSWVAPPLSLEYQHDPFSSFS